MSRRNEKYELKLARTYANINLMIDNLLRPMRGLFNVHLTAYQNCFVWQDCETVYGEANKGDRKAKFFKRPFKYLT